MFTLAGVRPIICGVYLEPSHFLTLSSRRTEQVETRPERREAVNGRKYGTNGAPSAPPFLDRNMKITLLRLLSSGTLSSSVGTHIRDPARLLARPLLVVVSCPSLPTERRGTRCHAPYRSLHLRD